MSSPGAGAYAQSILDTIGKFRSGDTTGGILNILLGSQIGDILEKLGFAGKPSNDTAYVWFTAGPHPQPWIGGNAGKNCTGNVCGDEANTESKNFGAAISRALAAIFDQAAAAGVTFNSPAFLVTVGARDAPGLLKPDHSGTWYARGLAAIGDAQGTVTGVLNWIAQFASSTSVAPGSTIMKMTPPLLPGAPPTNSPSSGTAPPTSSPTSGTAPPTAPAGAGFDWSQISNFSTPYPYAAGLAGLLFAAMMMRR